MCLVFLFFAQYFTTATLVTELCPYLACQNVREKTKCKERPCGIWSWNQCHWLLYSSLGHWERSRSTTEDQAVMCLFPHLCILLTRILTGTSYISEKAHPNQWAYFGILFTVGNIFLLLLLARPSHWPFGYCPQLGNIVSDLATDFIGWSLMDPMMGQLWAHTVFHFSFTQPSLAEAFLVSFTNFCQGFIVLLVQSTQNCPGHIS